MPSSQIQSYTSALLAAYAGASVLSSPPAGIIADRLSARQLPFLLGLVALLAATVMLHLGQTIAVLIVARVLQGVSAAVVWTIGLALLLDTVGAENLGVAIGSIFGFIRYRVTIFRRSVFIVLSNFPAWFSIGELGAPILGGILYEKAGYGAVFSIAYALLGIDFVMRFLIIEKKTAKKYKVDLEDETSPPDSDVAQDEESQDNEPDEEDPLIGSGKQESEWKITSDPPSWVRKLPILYCLSNPRLIVAQLVAFMQATLLSTFDATIPTEAKSLFGFDPLKAGLLFAPLVVPYLIGGPIAGKLVDKYGPKPAAVLGFAWEVLALILLRIPQAGGTKQIVVFCVIAALNGVGLAAIGSPSIVEASYVCEGYFKNNKEFFGGEGPYAQLYAINSMVSFFVYKSNFRDSNTPQVFSAGLTLGPLLAGSLRNSIGYGNMNAVVAAMCLVVSILSYVFLGGKPKLLRKHSL